MLGIASKKYNIPLIAGTDTHSLDKYKAECRTILQRAKKIIFTDEDKFDLTYKSYDELVNMFKIQSALSIEQINEAINNTNIEIQQGNFSSWKENKDRQDNFEIMQNEKWEIKIKEGIQLYTGHCTGDKAYALLEQKLKDQVHLIESGLTLQLK